MAERVTFEVECINRMYLNVFVPELQYPTALVGYVHRQLGLPMASTAPLGKITYSAPLRPASAGAVGRLPPGAAQGRCDA